MSMTENINTAQYREFASSRAALVTGASSGMGLHYAWQLAEYGYNVILVSNQREQLEAVAHEIAEKLGYSYQKFDNEGVLKSSHPHWVTGIYMDLSDPGSAERLFGMCRRNKIEVEVLINNAGIFFFRDIADCTPEKVGTILNLHVYTSTMLCRYFGEEMRRRKKGYILNMSSISTHTPFCGISLYTAT
ncbi:MAG: SDR family NAD(P)-dependent oxidoreductase, partial [Bacteroidales bacterium]|nr:SDR family NAD(P)-dependent oxidoreductase [Bacteroidales bacterium]